MTNTKSKPKAEIVVKVLEDRRLVFIYCASQDAHHWVKDNAPEFGIVTHNDFYDYYDLIVSPLYNIAEVADYIAIQGQNNV